MMPSLWYAALPTRPAHPRPLILIPASSVEDDNSFPRPIERKVPELCVPLVEEGPFAESWPW